MSARNGMCALWALAVLVLAGVGRADIRTGFGTESISFYPIDTFYSDSRFQFIIPREELRVSSGETLDGIRMQLASSTGYNPTLYIRMKNATQSDLDSMATGRFVNGGLTTIRALTTNIPNTPGWVTFNTAGFTLGTSNDLLVDLVMDKTSAGGDSYWTMVPTLEPCVRYGLVNTTPGFNLLNATGSFSVFDLRPIVRLVNVERVMPPIVADASQLVDPSGWIEADWKVEGHSCTIWPGVTLDFAPDFGLDVFENLYAQGGEGDSIRFTGTDWSGIQAFLPADTWLELDYCVIENTKPTNVAMYIYGTPSGEPSIIRNTTIHDAPGGIGLFGGYSPLDVDGLRVSNCGTGVYIYSSNEGHLQNLACTGNSQNGLTVEFATWALPSTIRNGLFSDNGGSGVSLTYSVMQLENLTVADNVVSGLAAIGNGTFQVMNCAFDNPAAPAEIHAYGGPAVVAANYSTVPGGAARCVQTSGAVLLFGSHVQTVDPMLDAQYRPLPGSPLIDAGSPVTVLDPDLTPADQGCYFFDQRAPLAVSAVDVPEDQGGRLQFVWNASSMDLAQASDQWFYSVWRLDTLFSASRSVLPVVHTRRQVEAAIAAGRPFTWQRDGAAWNWLATVPAARFAQYALVVETLADRLDGQPWTSPLKVLWHAGDVLSESQVITGTSVDNVPPDAPLLLASTTQAPGSLRLGWQPVTTGTVNGQALPERNGVMYHVYETPAPYVPQGSGILLGTTSDTEFLLPLPQPNTQRFFRVNADDAD